MQLLWMIAGAYFFRTSRRFDYSTSLNCHLSQDISPNFENATSKDIVRLSLCHTRPPLDAQSIVADRKSTKPFHFLWISGEICYECYQCLRRVVRVIAGRHPQ